MYLRIVCALPLVALSACVTKPQITRTAEAPEVVGRIVPQSATLSNVRVFGTFGEWSRVLADTGGDSLVIDPLTGVVVNRIEFGDGQRHAAIAPDGRHLCIADRPVLGGEEQGSIGVYDLEEDRWLWRKPGGLVVVTPYATRTACAFHLSEKRKRVLRLHALRTGEVLETRPPITGNFECAHSCIYSPDGEWLFKSYPSRTSKKGAPWEHYAVRLQDFASKVYFHAGCLDVRGDTLHVRPEDEEAVRASTESLPYRIAASASACALPTWPLVEEEQLHAFLADGTHVLTRRWVESSLLKALEVASSSSAWFTRRIADGQDVADLGRERLSLVSGDHHREEPAIAASLDGTHLYLHEGEGLYVWQWQEGAPTKLASVSQLLQQIRGQPRYVPPAVSSSRRWIATVDASGMLRRIPHEGGAELAPIKIPVGPDGSAYPIWKLAIDDGGRVAVLVQSGYNQRLLYLSSPGDSSVLVPVPEFEASGLTASELRFVALRSKPWLVMLHRYDGVTVFDPRTAKKHAQYVPDAVSRELSELKIDAESSLLTFYRPSGGEEDTTAGRWQLTLPDLGSPERLEPTTAFPKQDELDPYRRLAEPILAPDSVFGIYELKKKAGIRIDARGEGPLLILGIREGQPFAYAPDGRYFCEAEACKEFRCVGPAQQLLPLEGCAAQRVRSVQELLR